MKKLTFLTIFLSMILVVVFNAYATSDNDFVLNIVHDGYPVNEIDKQVAIPFNAEYKIRLKNGHDRKCTAKVFIDGALVSKLGDFIINAKGEIDLERFLDSSLTDGKRFKFVRLTHPDVDDPNREENGLIRVEFRLEKIVKVPEIQVYPEYEFKIPGDWHYLPHDWKPDIHTMNDAFVFCSNNSATAPGATVEGSESSQTFHKAYVDVEDRVYALELRMVGLNKYSYLP